MRMQSFHLSAQGASHIKKNKECQDASESYYDEHCAIAIVCDGHGGDDYVRSASGSAFACAAAKENILNFIVNVNKDELSHHNKQLIYKLEASIISKWNESIYAHYEANPFTDEEIAVLSERAKRKYLHEKRIESAYGTTLIAVVITQFYWFGIHIGDGKCVAVNPEGRFLQPIPWDEKCFLNATTSICDSDALNRFRSFYSEKLPVAVFVGSDGIDDCFCSEEQLNNLYKTVLYSFTTSEFDDAVSDLRDYLPRLSAKGSGDDVSVAAILDIDSIGTIEVVKMFDKEKEKARVEENARIAAQKSEEERLLIEAMRTEQLEQQEDKKNAPKFCENCGVKLRTGMKFCPDCGKRIIGKAVDGITQVTPPPLTNTDDLKITMIVPFGNEHSIPVTNNEAMADVDNEGIQEQELSQMTSSDTVESCDDTMSKDDTSEASLQGREALDANIVELICVSEERDVVELDTSEVNTEDTSTDR